MLTPGSTVFTGPNSEAILLFSNGATSTLGPDSTVLIEGFVQKEFEGSDKTVGQFAEEISSSRLKLDLDVGELILNVKKLKKDSSLIISTPMGMAGVRGTHFKVAVSKDASSVGVLSGAVDFLNLQNQALPLGKGTKLESTNQTPSRQFALPPGEKTRIETATLAARQKTAAFSLVKLSQAFAEINPGQGAVGGDLKGGDLWILMHVDGSGSILETRKSLEAMRGTIMKKALLPFYMNDPNLYERRVQVVDGQGERTLQFFAHAAKKENVLAMVFQDEAQPVYHMPNFNKQPSKQYAQDLTALKQRLTGRAGLYRGVMLQVDRGKTPAKSFVEFVQNAWQGGGYLRGANLQKYYWKENKHHVLKQTGTVFSDVYQVKDDGDPTYYLNLIFKEAKKVGLDLEKLSR